MIHVSMVMFFFLFYVFCFSCVGLNWEGDCKARPNPDSLITLKAAVLTLALLRTSEISLEETPALLLLSSTQYYHLINVYPSLPSRVKTVALRDKPSV